jgi:queuine tRNA-ribosyltransferase
MHSVSEPSEESRLLYVEQPRLAARLEAAPLTIWDVGLGAATNAMAAILSLRPSPERPLRIVSFENDLDSLRLALRFPNLFAHLRHAGPTTLLERGAWRTPDGSVEWVLRAGDFRDTLEGAPAADVIWHDPFSPRTDSVLWSRGLFERMREASPGAELLTYSNSTAVRGRLLAAGWWVAAGSGTGPKRDTTRAFAGEPASRSGLLDQDWLGRWHRSSAREAALDAEVEGHAQFRAGENQPRTMMRYAAYEKTGATNTSIV